MLSFTLISIITPIYNSEKYLQEMIQSVLNQTYQNWELILINDGSTDGSKEIISMFADERMRYFEQGNQGVSAARNVGLKAMNGTYFCFLDADDVLPPNSLSGRLECFKDNLDVCFVDGVVEKWNEDFTALLGTWNPNFQGNPLRDLVELNGNCFFGLSWMIRREVNIHYSMKEGLTHAEDLLFYADLSRDQKKHYTYTNEVVLKYRVHSASAMGNLDQLALGYKQLLVEFSAFPEVAKKSLNSYRMRIRRIMFLSYMRRGDLIKAIRSVI